jgi:hypothetical protein
MGPGGVEGLLIMFEKQVRAVYLDAALTLSLFG